MEFEPSPLDTYFDTYLKVRQTWRPSLILISGVEKFIGQVHSDFEQLLPLTQQKYQHNIFFMMKAKS